MANILDPTHQNTGTQTVPSSETENFKLILCLADTITSWLNIFNTNMSRIDVAMHNLELRTSINGTVPPEAIEDIIKLNSEISALKEKYATTAELMNTLKEKVTNLETQTATNTADIRTLLTNYTNLDTRMSTAEVSIQDNTKRIVKLETNSATA